MPKSKRHPGTVGVYLLRSGVDGNWETLVHRRSDRVHYGGNCIATPGGFVDNADCVDEKYILNLEHGYYQALYRETYEETGFELENIDPGNIEMLDPLAVASSTHRNFLVHFNTNLIYAEPLPTAAWEW